MEEFNDFVLSVGKHRKREDFDRRITHYPHTWGNRGGDGGGKMCLEVKYDFTHIMKAMLFLKLEQEIRFNATLV